MDLRADQLGRFARGTVQVDTWTRPDGETFLAEARLPADPHAALLVLRGADDGAPLHLPIRGIGRDLRSCPS
jgi:hypothetical protein